MLPRFPQFKPIELDDQAAVETITRQYPPYSDYNFTSLWSWDVRRAIRLCELAGSLVVRFTDYITGSPFYSFLGGRDPGRTAQELLDQMASEGLEPQLRLVPEVSVSDLDREIFAVTEDPDNNDYILSTQSVKEMKGKKWGKRRQQASHFQRHHHPQIRPLDLNDQATKSQLKAVFAVWIVEKGICPAEAENELLAFRRCLSLPDYSSMQALGLFVSEELVGFSLNEILPAGYAMAHFQKARLASFKKGIYPYLDQQSAHALLEKDVVFLNLEQDLGLPGLRRHKRESRPCGYLRKYSVTTTSAWPATPPKRCVCLK